jgi:hypothetical protein
MAEPNCTAAQLPGRLIQIKKPNGSLATEVGQRLGRGAGDAGPTTTGVGHDRSWQGQAYQLLLFRMVSSA